MATLVVLPLPNMASGPVKVVALEAFATIDTDVFIASIWSTVGSSPASASGTVTVKKSSKSNSTISGLLGTSLTSPSATGAGSGSPMIAGVSLVPVMVMVTVSDTVPSNEKR